MDVSSTNNDFTAVHSNDLSSRKEAFQSTQRSIVCFLLAKCRHNHSLVGNVKVHVRCRHAFPRNTGLVLLVWLKAVYFFLRVELSPDRTQVAIDIVGNMNKDTNTYIHISIYNKHLISIIVVQQGRALPTTRQRNRIRLDSLPCRCS